MRRRLLVSLVSLLCFSAVPSYAEEAAATPAKDMQASAAETAMKENLFTLPLSAYQLNDKDPGQRVYKKPGVDLKQYQSVIIELPLFLHQNEDKQWELLQPSEQSKLATYIKSRITMDMAKHGIQVVDEAGPGVLRVRFAITGMAQTRPGLDLIDVLPAKAAINIAKLAIGKEPYLVRIGTMAQVEDSVSGELLAGTVNLKETSKNKTRDKAVTLEYLERDVNKFSKNSAAQLARAMGKQ